ncbi:MAG: hypothetical protein A3I02_14590 [Betaproteobacteria bacterium RIFCSPLOWO2_02_FULL_67_26]|nr:MAG: hypothetical protein A3I02_14590 [Betaproteobacteria bacterium RIFCSPLOWO2_02_FULL_67_26]
MSFSISRAPELTISRLLFLTVLLAGCVQLPPSPQDLQAKKFEAVPDKAVIYLVRDYPDHSERAATIWLGDATMITTYAGTYYRWEVAPGAHRITGYGADTGSITLRAEPGRLYFVQQRIAPLGRFAQSYFQVVSEPQGRTAVMRAVLLGGS